MPQYTGFHNAIVMMVQWKVYSGQKFNEIPNKHFIKTLNESAIISVPKIKSKNKPQTVNYLSFLERLISRSYAN